MAIRASVKAVEQTAAKLETTEIRKQKVDCLVAVCGLRFVILDQLWPSLEFRSRYLYEMNKIAVLWSDDPEVLNNVRDVLNGSSNDKLVRLMRNMGRSTALPLQNLADADLTRIFLIPPQ